MGSGILGFQPSLHHQPQPNPHHNSSSSSSHSTHQNPKPLLSYISPLTLNNAEDDSELNNDDHDHEKRNKNNTNSPWHRMKWTDSMVKLLLRVVVCNVGDEAAVTVTVTEMLQKKRKWKSVSKAMMERGFLVSPQQCEDKFNDLSKRYKRVNDILGKEDALRAVENQSSLDKIDRLSPKTKEEVKKLLNSKHLFFREMHAYHNGCGHMNPASVLEPILEQRRRQEDEDEEPEEWSRKRSRLMAEMTGMIQNEKKSLREKREWMKERLMKLEEERVSFLEEGLKLEMGRMKWRNYIRKKEMEIEEEKMEEKKLKIENDRMMLLVLRKEVELAIQQR